MSTPNKHEKGGDVEHTTSLERFQERRTFGVTHGNMTAWEHPEGYEVTVNGTVVLLTVNQIEELGRLVVRDVLDTDDRKKLDEVMVVAEQSLNVEDIARARDVLQTLRGQYGRHKPSFIDAERMLRWVEFKRTRPKSNASRGALASSDPDARTT